MRRLFSFIRTILHHLPTTWILVMFCTSMDSNLFGQYQLQILSEDTTLLNSKFKPYLSPHQEDSISIRKALKSFKAEMIKEGNLETSIDSFWIIDTVFFAKIHLGPSYDSINLGNGNLEKALLNDLNLNSFFNTGPIALKKVNIIQDALLEKLENNGYPFASTWLDSIQLNNGKAKAQFFLNRNQFIKWNRILNNGNLNISNSFLHNYLNIHKQSPFNKKTAEAIEKKLDVLSYARQGAAPFIKFDYDMALVDITLNKKNASMFDFLIGVLPPTEERNTLRITGNVKMNLANQLGRGETIFLDFEQIRPETQKLRLKTNYPYPFGIPIQIEAKLALFKRDTSTQDIDYGLGFKYGLMGSHFIKAFWTHEESRLLGFNESAVVNLRQLPSTIDFSKNFIGLSLSFVDLDYPFNPLKGWQYEIKGSVGLKQLKKNPRILALEDAADPDFNFESLYNEFESLTYQFVISPKFEFYLPTFKNQTLKTALQGKLLFSKSKISQNEQTLLGGNQLLRGFDERSILATKYVLLTTEYRLLTGTNSYLYSFMDVAWVQNQTISTNDNDYPYGFGVGITFDTKAGLFGLKYALGSQRNNPINFSSAKIHFGYLSLF